MDFEALLNLILYVPILLVAIVTGIIIFISGYKRGLWRALLSLGTTVVATGLSILFARLLSSATAGALMGVVPAEMFEELGATASLAASLAQGVVQMILSLVFFAVLLLIFLIVLKCVGNHIR